MASLAGGLAQSDVWLIAARAVQGLGAALISPAALAIVTTTFAEGAERNKALGVWGAVAGSGGAAGVLLGGILTECLGWEWVLFVNIPIGIAAALLAPRLLEESRDESRASFDIAGAVSVTAGLALLVYTLVDANDAGWGSTQTLGLGARRWLLLAAFVADRVAHAPPAHAVLDLPAAHAARGERHRPAARHVAVLDVLLHLALHAAGAGLRAAQGRARLPAAGAARSSSSAGVASQLVTRIGFKPTLIAGLLFVAGGLVWFAQVSAPGGSYVGDVLFPSMLAAIGLGLSFVPVTIAAVTGTKPDEAGLASGLINTSQQVGGALGLAILATVATATTNDAFASGERNPAVALTEGFQDAFLVGAGHGAAGRGAGRGADLLAGQPRARRGGAARRRGAGGRGCIERVNTGRPRGPRCTGGAPLPDGV